MSTSIKTEAPHQMGCCACGDSAKELEPNSACPSCGNTLAESQAVFLVIREEVVDKLFVTADEVAPASRLQDLGEDSLGLLEMLMVLEERLDVAFDGEAHKMQTVSDIVRFIVSQAR